MGTTKTTDLVIPEILAEAIQAEFAGMQLLLGSGAAVVSNTLPGDAKGGKVITVPYFDALSEMEDIANEGDALTPATLSMSEETTTVRHSGKAVDITWWAQIAAQYADPYAEVARQFRVLTERRVDKALLDAAYAALPGAYIHNVWNATTPVTLSYDVIVDAKQKWGDEQDGIVLLGVHSKTYGDLQKQKDKQDRPLLTFPADGSVPRAAGMPVKVSDKNTKSADVPPKYTSLLVKRSALAFWFQGTPRVLTAQDVLADTNVAAIHMYWAAHRYKRISGLGTHPGVIQIVHN